MCQGRTSTAGVLIAMGIVENMCSFPRGCNAVVLTVLSVGAPGRVRREIAVFESAAARDADARSAGVMLLPGTGFDVVPSDCLALHVARKLPDAHALTLGFFGLGSVAHGTATTMVENVHRGGFVRRDGKLTPVPTGSLVRDIDYAPRRRRCLARLERDPS